MENGLLPVLAEIFGEALGLDPGSLDPEASFLELGADSLTLLQASQKIESRLGVSVPFRTLLEEHPSIAALGAYLNEQGAGTPTPATPEPAQKPPAAVPEAAPGSALERIIRQQLQVMAVQLEALGQGRRDRPVPVETVKAPPPAQSSPDRAEPETFVPFKVLDVGPGQGLTLIQQEHLDGLVARYTHRTRGSRRLAETERSVFADSMSSAGFGRPVKEMVYPIVTERSAGSRVWDVDGNEYLDMNMGFGVHFFGHAPRFIQEALGEQIERGFELGPQSVLTGEVARLVSELTGMDRVAFCTSGTEAVMGALRIARAVTRRSRVICFAGSYHGGFDGVLARPGEGYGALRSLPLAPGVLPAMVQDVRVLPYDRPETLEYLRERAGELAAILVEPVQSRRPDVQPAAFLRELRRITEAAGTALIFDEVITGFRLHPRGAQGWFGIQADLATYGKVAGGGLPIGLVAGKARFMDAVDGGNWSYGDASYPRAEQTFLAHTFAKHPLSMAAARAALTHLRSRGGALQEGLNRQAAGLVHRLNAWLEGEEVPIRVASCGSIFRFLYPAGVKLVDLFFYHLVERGIFILRGRPCFLSTAHTPEDLDRFFGAVVDSVTEMRRGGFLERGTVPAPVLWASPPQQVVEAPLTEGQQQLWLLAQLSPEASRAYNQVVVLRVRGPFSRPAFQRAVAALVERHEALRTVIAPEGDRQRVLPRIDIDLPFVDLIGGDPQEWMAESTAEPFDLARGPLFRIHVAKLAEDDTALLFNFHHVISDGWSIGILLSELAALYGGVAAAALPEPVQYRTYVEWLARKLESPELERAEVYWLAELRDGAPSPDLPADRPRPLVQTFAGAREVVWVERPLLDPLLKAAARLGCTPFMATLAAFRVFLYGITGRKDYVLGVPAAGQALLHERLVGYCINLLAVKTRTAGGMSLAEVLLEVKGKMAAAYEHQLYPFPRLVRKVNPPRDAGRAPIVNATFNLDRSPAADFGGLDVSFLPYQPDVANMDLEINLIESAARLRVQWDFSTGLFDRSTVRRWMAAFASVVEQMGTDPEKRVEECSLLSEAERHAVIHERNDTAAEPLKPCIHELFEACARRTPEAVAVSFEGTDLTYGELDRRANQLARFLRRIGVGPEVLVGLGVERSPELLVGLLGILKAGGAYLPLDASYPGQRLMWMLEDARAEVVVTQASLEPALPLQGPLQGLKAIRIDEDWPRIERESGGPLASTVARDNLAYAIFTSGSTGRPKGVQISHGGVVNFLASMRREPGLDAGDVLLSVTTLSFDIAALELLLPLAVGARVELVSRETVADGRLLADALVRSGATVLQATPATWRVLLESGWQGDGRLRSLCGGEALTRELANRLLECGGPVWNLYGPTETTIWSATGQVAAGEGDVTLGPPIRNTQLYVLDGGLAPAPLGVPGELCIGGAGLARGYLGRPDLTAERFIPDPFGHPFGHPFGPAGERLYRTGDLVRLLARGGIEFMGRLDDQVKIRGFRIELGEIQSVLEQHPGVEGVAVIVKRYSAGDHRIVAFFVAAVPEATPASLRRLARERLPEHMIPAALIAVDRLPLLPNGKVDRHTLSQWAGAKSGARDREEVVPPRTATEKAVARIWQTALRVDALSVHDDFFNLGGHSLLVPRIWTELRQSGWPGVSMVDLFRHPTLGSFAAHLDTLAARDPGEPGLLVEPKPGDPSLPPLVLVHAVGGTVFFYRDLVRHLRTERAVYGIQSRGIDGIAPPVEGIEEMAALYLQEIERAVPVRSFLLAGASMGGAVAFEMARQAVRKGSMEVELLALLDTPGPGDLPLPRDEEELRAFVVRDVASRRDAGLTESLLPLWTANYRSLLSYAPASSWPGRLAYFRARERHASDPSHPEQKWVALSEGGADVQIVPGDHASMLREPAVEGSPAG